MASTRIACDIVIIHDLRASTTVGPDRWGKTRPQPITLSAHVETSLADAGKSDDVADSIHYGHLAKSITKLTDGATFDSLLELAEAVAELALRSDERVRGVEVDAYAGNQFLQAENLGVHIRRIPQGVTATEVRDDRTMICDLRVATIIGVNPPEREAKQNVLVNLTFYGFDWSRSVWHEIHATMVKVSSLSADQTLVLDLFVRLSKVPRT